MNKFIEIVPTYPLPVSIYGKEDYFTWPVKLMKSNEYTVEIFTLRKKNQKETEILNGILIKRFINPLSLYFNLVKEKGALVYSQGKLFPIFASIFSNRAVYNPHGSFGHKLPKYLRNLFFRYIWKQLFKRFYRVIAITKFELNTYLRLGFGKNIVYIPNLIDFDYFSRKPRNYSFSNRYNPIINRFIVFVGNIHGDVKNINVLVEAFKIVNRKFKNSKLVIIGKVLDDNLIIKTLINESNNNKNIIFTGWLNYKDIRNFLSIASVFVNTSKNEGHSLAVGEAAAAGVPLCLSKIGVFQKTYGKTAMYHNPSDYKALANNILYYLNNKKIANKDAVKNQLLAKNSFHQSIVMKKMKNLLIDDTDQMKGVENEWQNHWDKSSIEHELKEISYETNYTDNFTKLFRKGDKVLEAGCGFGRYCFWFSSRGILSYGIDIVRKAITEGKNYVKENNIRNVSLKEGNICKLPYKDNYFNGYISLGVVEHFKNRNDIESAFREAYRVLKPGGYAYFSIPNPYAIHMWPEKILNIINVNMKITHYLLTKNDLLHLAKIAKFEVIYSGYHDFYFPLYSIVRSIARRDIWALKSIMKKMLSFFDDIPILKNCGSGISVVLQKGTQL